MGATPLICGRDSEKSVTPWLSYTGCLRTISHRAKSARNFVCLIRAFKKGKNKCCFEAVRLQSSLTLFIATTFGWSQARAQNTTEQPDKYQWLEDVYGERSMAWVNAENERSAKALDVGPVYDTLAETALKVLESPTRLPSPQFRVGTVYNTWQDAQHVRGILRRTSLDSYLTDQPDWHTVIDYDALATQDNEKWVQKGLNCLYPGDGLCLVALSAGGEDADTLREFDLKTGKFVEGGFVLPHSKQNVAWVDKDTLLVARNWGPGTMTQSGYAFVVKLWKRGTPLDDAKEVYRGTPSDVSAGPGSLHDSQGHSAILLSRGVNFFERRSLPLHPRRPKKNRSPGQVARFTACSTARSS